MEVWERLKAAMEKANSYDSSKFVDSFQPVCEDFKEEKDDLYKDTVKEIEKLADKLEKITDYFLELEHANKHGKVKQKWRGKWQA